MPDQHKNFAYSTVLIPPSPPNTGLSLEVAVGDGVKFPGAPFNTVVCPAGLAPLDSNAEIVRVTAIAGDTFTLLRQQEGTNAREIAVGDQIYAAYTAKTMTDVEAEAAAAASAAAASASAVVDLAASSAVDYAQKANNLSDLINKGVARGNLGIEVVNAEAIFASETDVTSVPVGTPSGRTPLFAMATLLSADLGIYCPAAVPFAGGATIYLVANAYVSGLVVWVTVLFITT